ncbi:hypothetical protein D9M70_508560 [compost metagenome]
MTSGRSTHRCNGSPSTSRSKSTWRHSICLTRTSSSEAVSPVGDRRSRAQSRFGSDQGVRRRAGIGRPIRTVGCSSPRVAAAEASGSCRLRQHRAFACDLVQCLAAQRIAQLRLSVDHRHTATARKQPRRRRHRRTLDGRDRPAVAVATRAARPSHRSAAQGRRPRDRHGRHFRRAVGRSGERRRAGKSS